MDNLRQDKTTYPHENNNSVSQIPKISRGVKNKKHKTYQKNERLIEQTLHKAIETRTISVRVKDVCEAAQISSPTFYLHYRSVDAALSEYENKLEQKYLEMLPKDFNKELRFTLLLTFIRKYHRYFAACLEGRNFYLIIKLVQLTRPNLAQTKINRKAYTVYMATIIGILVCFGEIEKFNNKAIPEYAKKLTSLRIMDYGL